MSDTITIDKAGRIVLPKSLREQFKLTGGAKLRIESVGDHLELTPVEGENAEPLLKKDGLLVVAATGESCDAAAQLRSDRETREDAITAR